MPKLSAGEGCVVALAVGFIVVLCLTLGFLFLTGMVALVANVLLPILGLHYELTTVQCFAAGGVLMIVGGFIRGLFSVTVSS